MEKYIPKWKERTSKRVCFIFKQVKIISKTYFIVDTKFLDIGALSTSTDISGFLFIYRIFKQLAKKPKFASKRVSFWQRQLLGIHLITSY